MGIPSSLLVFIQERFLFGEKYQPQKELVYLIFCVFQKGEIMTQNMLLGILLLKFYVVVLLKKSDSERFSEPFELAVVRDERKPFHREAVQEELEVQIVRESDIALHFHLNFR